MHRIGLLSSVIDVIVHGTDDEKIMQERITEYNNTFGDLPEDFQILFDAKPLK